MAAGGQAGGNGRLGIRTRKEVFGVRTGEELRRSEGALLASWLGMPCRTSVHRHVHEMLPVRLQVCECYCVGGKALLLRELHVPWHARAAHPRAYGIHNGT